MYPFEKKSGKSQTGLGALAKQAEAQNKELMAEKSKTQALFAGVRAGPKYGGPLELVWLISAII